jgi:hypothetical protein
MAIGLGISNSYNTKSPTTTAWEGTLDAISAGILLYTGLVEVSLPLYPGGDIEHRPYLPNPS